MRFKAGSANDEPAAVPAVLAHRRAGVLLHPTSLPSGTLDTDALRFMDWLQSGGFTVWQMLPLGPVGLNGSPYSPDSAFAGNFELVPRGNRVAGINASALVRFRQDAAHWLGDYVLFRAIREELPGLPWWDWPVALRQREPQSLRRFAANHAAALTR
ncbi:MAG: 4-alpha-glucanotransferase, partial [Lysobacterales bacterium]